MVYKNRGRFQKSKSQHGLPEYAKYAYEQRVQHKTYRAIAKEPKALSMFKILLDSIENGNDQKAREILLYRTPFYFRGIIDDKVFFDSHWPGGFEDFKEKRESIHNK